MDERKGENYIPVGINAGGIIMHTWAEFCKILPVKNIGQVLESPLWYNENLGQGKAFFKNWYEKGIQVLLDIISEDGEFYTFEELKAKYDIKGTFLDYHSLINNIPES